MMTTARSFSDNVQNGKRAVAATEELLSYPIPRPDASRIDHQILRRHGKFRSGQLSSHPTNKTEQLVAVHHRECIQAV